MVLDPRKAPLLPVAAALMAGILAGHHCAAAPTWVLALGLALCAVATGGLLLLRRNAMPALLLAVALAGGLLCRNVDPRYSPHHWSRHCSGRAYLAVRLTSTPTPYERSLGATARVLSVDGAPVRGDLRLYLRRDSLAHTLRYGDRLLLHVRPDTVRHSAYATSDHYIVTHRDRSSLRAASEHLRMRLLRRMQRGPLDERHAAVAEALTLGYRADIDPDTRAAYRDAGIAHLLSVSGLHVGLLAAIVGGALFWTGRERRGRIVRGSIQLAAIWTFALLTGLAPATTRAALMFSLLVLSGILGQRTPSLNLLALTALLTLVPSPMLLFNLGWQLSYAAVTGIIVARPIIVRWRNRLYQAAAVSLAATVATTPFTVATFHQLHPYFLIANVAVVPLAAVILGLSLLYMLLPCPLTAWPTALCLDLVSALTRWVASLPGATIAL